MNKNKPQWKLGLQDMGQRVSQWVAHENNVQQNLWLEYKRMQASYWIANKNISLDESQLWKIFFLEMVASNVFCYLWRHTKLCKRKSESKQLKQRYGENIWGNEEKKIKINKICG
jgi:hypothetical protein